MRTLPGRSSAATSSRRRPRHASSAASRLADALELTALIATKDRARSRRMAARWLERWLTETPAPEIDDAVMVAGCLAALGGDAHENAVWSLRELLAGQARRPRVAHA